jgi:DNA-binding response OmpR family regulator
MYKILVVEDEPEMRLGLQKNLTFEGYKVDLAHDGEQGLNMLLAQHYHLALLDIMMPKLTGLDVCRKAREKGNKTPIIMLTAKGQEIDKVLGLEMGAEDYITKPFSLRELLARVKVVLRRYENSVEPKAENIQIGKLKVNLKSYTASSENQTVAMTFKEIEILKYLLQNRNNIVTRDELLDNIWGEDEIVTPRTVDNFIYKLRQKIEDKADHPLIIKTVHKAGYKLIL